MPDEHLDTTLASIRQRKIAQFTLRHRLRGRAEEVLAYGWYTVARYRVPEKRFIIFSQARSGSTLLTHLLNSHPDIRCDREVLLNQLDVLDTPRFLKAHSARWNCKGYGCKIFIQQLLVQRHRLVPAMENLLNDGWQLIYLQRRNIVRQTLSLYIASNRAIWHETTNNPLSDYNVHIVPQHLLAKLMERKRIMLAEESLIDRFPHLPLVYEDHLLRAEGHQATAEKIFEYLGFATSPVHAPDKKISPEHLSDIISNYDAVEAALRQTEFAHFLDEE